MSKKQNKKPEISSDYWQELFDNLEIKSIPIEYLKALNIHFHDGRVWNVIIDQSNPDNISVEDSIEQLLEEYDKDIHSVTFDVNTEKIKKDIEKRTKTFLKKGK